jgi:hypothetical protein
VKAVKGGFGPRATHLGGRRKSVYRSAFVLAPGKGGSVEIAGFVGHGAGYRIKAIRVVEGLDDGFLGCESGTRQEQQGR